MGSKACGKARKGLSCSQVRRKRRAVAWPTERRTAVEFFKPFGVVLFSWMPHVPKAFQHGEPVY